LAVANAEVSLSPPPQRSLSVCGLDIAFIISENRYDGAIRSVSHCFVYVCKWRTERRECLCACGVFVYGARQRHGEPPVLDV
jgi:hypothetical protein